MRSPLVRFFHHLAPRREKRTHQCKRDCFCRFESATENSEAFPNNILSFKARLHARKVSCSPTLTAVILLAYGHSQKIGLCFCQNMHRNKLQTPGFLLASLQVCTVTNELFLSLTVLKKRKVLVKILMGMSGKTTSTPHDREHSRHRKQASQDFYHKLRPA